MGLLKIIGIAAGLPLRPTTTRERSRRYQREANDLLEQQLHAIQDQAQPRNVTQVRQVPSDTRPRRACPECLEMMLVGASTCPHCRTTGIASEQVIINRQTCTFGHPADWAAYCEICMKESLNAKAKEPTSTNSYNESVDCPSGCGGILYLEDGGDIEDCLVCAGCNDYFEKKDYPHLY
jgi:hypothetical protein